MNNNNELPSLSILGSVSMASVLPRTYGQDSFGAQQCDELSSSEPYVAARGLTDEIHF